MRVGLVSPYSFTYPGGVGRHVEALAEELIRQGRLRPLTDPRALELSKRDTTLDWPRRDPDLLVDMILSAVR